MWWTCESPKNHLYMGVLTPCVREHFVRGVIVGRAETCPLSVFSPLFSSGQERCGFRSTVVHTHPFNGPFSGTTQVSWYQKGKSNLDFTEARDSEWQWHQLGHMQVCTLLQTDIHTSTPPLSFLQAGCPSCHPTNSVKAPKARSTVVVTCVFCAGGLRAGVGFAACISQTRAGSQ